MTKPHDGRHPSNLCSVRSYPAPPHPTPPHPTPPRPAPPHPTNVIKATRTAGKAVGRVRIKMCETPRAVSGGVSNKDVAQTLTTNLSRTSCLYDFYWTIASSTKLAEQPPDHPASPCRTLWNPGGTWWNPAANHPDHPAALADGGSGGTLVELNLIATAGPEPIWAETPMLSAVGE